MDNLETIKFFLNNKNKQQILVIIGDRLTKSNILKEYDEFLKLYERNLSIYPPDYANNHYPYYYLNLYEKRKQLYKNDKTIMFDHYILYIKGEQPQCPYYSIHEDKNTFIVKQIYLRPEYDDFVKALCNEYGSDNCIIIY